MNTRLHSSFPFSILILLAHFPFVTKFVTIKQANEADVQCCEMITWKLFHTNRCRDFPTFFQPTHTLIRTHTFVPTYLILSSLVLLLCSIPLRHHYHFSISLGCLSNRTYHITHIILEIVLHFRVFLSLWVGAWAWAWMWVWVFGFHVWMITFMCHIHIDFTKRDEKNALRCIEPKTHTHTSSILAIVGTARHDTSQHREQFSHRATHAPTSYTHIHK